MYEISWPRDRWVSAGQIMTWYWKAVDTGIIRLEDRTCTEPTCMARALHRAGAITLTGAEKR